MSSATEGTENRCSWCLGSELYRHYHDTEWGVPCRDAVQLFELISLEGAQAGLSWITILNKRQGYRRLFAGFDPEKIARFSDARLDRIASDAAIVRHRQKVESVRSNARAWLSLREAGQSFSDVIWAHVEHETLDNAFRQLSDVPARTEQSTRMSKQLKKLGFSFVGPTTCYAFMQAAGLVNDHLITCPRHAEVKSG
ncbi:DNA-3-methyladenine glycosylase I [Granulosicoccus sp. 3-233]|uniref:DNA-3-methyladenine glycosylase I n=1 Tax=Granulosicoccus sp. 3-233 TaxID=3417969 RepID=UPI003D3364DF